MTQPQELGLADSGEKSETHCGTDGGSWKVQTETLEQPTDVLEPHSMEAAELLSEDLCVKSGPPAAGRLRSLLQGGKLEIALVATLALGATWLFSRFLRITRQQQKQLQLTCGNLQKQLHSKEHEIAMLQGQLAHQNTQLQSVAAAQAQLEVQLYSTMQDAASSREELEKSTKRVHDTATQLHVLVSELQLTKQQLHHARQELENALADLQTTQAKLQDSNGELGLTKSQMGLVNQELNATRRQLMAAEMRLERASFDLHQSENRDQYRWQD